MTLLSLSPGINWVTGRPCSVMKIRSPWRARSRYSSNRSFSVSMGTSIIERILPECATRVKPNPQPGVETPGWGIPPFQGGRQKAGLRLHRDHLRLHRHHRLRGQLGEHGGVEVEHA